MGTLKDTVWNSDFLSKVANDIIRLVVDNLIDTAYEDVFSQHGIVQTSEVSHEKQPSLEHQNSKHASPSNIAQSESSKQPDKDAFMALKN